MKYYAYGSTRSGSVPTDKKFTGQRLDGSGLYYYGARYYDVGIGRFVSADPLVQTLANPQALNRYSYVWGNPLKYIDPTGLLTEAELLTGGVSQEQIRDWRDYNPDLWRFIQAVYAYETVTITSGGLATTYWFAYVFSEGPQKGTDLADYSGGESDVCCNPTLVLKYLQQTILGTQGGQEGVGTLGTAPGNLDFSRDTRLTPIPAVHLVVGYGKAFVARGDAYALKYYAAAGLDAVATGGQVLGTWTQGCDVTCASQIAFGAYLATMLNPFPPLAVMGVYAVAGWSDLWVPIVRERAARLRR